MVDIHFIRQNPSLVQQKAKDKNIIVNIDHVLHIDAAYRELSTEVQKLQSERNLYAKERNIEKGKEIKNLLDKKEHDVADLKEELRQELLKIPNPAADDVPVAKDEDGNVEVKKVGTIPSFDFTPKTHDELALALDLYDAERAVKIAGTRAYFLKNDLVLLEQALLRFGLDTMVKNGFTPMSVPWMVNKDALWGTGYFPWGAEDHYTTQDDQALIGTAEVSLTAYHQNEILEEKNLPIKMVGISPCFRREVGTYGKDTKGFIRVHQFNKVEQVVLTVADEEETRKWHEQMLGYSEDILIQLELPYRVLLMCTGDMGAGQRKKFDIETWFPSQNKYRETHSASYFNDFQSRRLNIKYKTKDNEKKFVYTLNNTVIATPRLLAAILENYQQKDGTILVPKVLQKYFEKEKIS